MMNLENKFKNKKIIVTGHTGFKGSWLTYWLLSFGAKVIGISKDIPTKPSNYEALNLKKKCIDLRLDITNLKNIKKLILNKKPDYIFHLAAQSLVNKSYNFPVETFKTNSMGTLNILESLRSLKKKCTVVIITSDKSYKNIEIERGYKEDDILGGDDPYSASKGSAEIIIQSYLKSYFQKQNKILIGIARAGNVIGGGDWSENRLIPDCMKSWSKNKRVIIRNPKSTRPWQHVLEALGGYLIFAVKLNSNKKLHGQIFNFGPSSYKEHEVIKLVKYIKKFWNKFEWKIVSKKNTFHESKLLKLNCNKAKKILKWKSVLNFNEMIGMVTKWYKCFYTNKKEIEKLSTVQIKTYQKILNNRL